MFALSNPTPDAEVLHRMKKKLIEVALPLEAINAGGSISYS